MRMNVRRDVAQPAHEARVITGGLDEPSLRRRQRRGVVHRGKYTFRSSPARGGFQIEEKTMNLPRS
jgi:hypothetical protein